MEAAPIRIVVSPMAGPMKPSAAVPGAVPAPRAAGWPADSEEFPERRGRASMGARELWSIRVGFPDADAEAASEIGRHHDSRADVSRMTVHTIDCS